MKRVPPKPARRNKYMKAILSVMVVVLLFVLLVPNILNHRNGQYENLNSTD